MGKFDGILLCTDLDGTLLKNDKSISARDEQALNYFKENGGMLSVMTGRMSFVLEPIIEAVKPNVPVGFGNGLGIYDFEHNQKLHLSFTDSSVLTFVKKVYETFPEIGIEITTHDRIYCARVNDCIKKHLSDEGIQLVTADIDGFDEPIAKILFAAVPDRLEEFIRAISTCSEQKQFQFLRSDHIYHEILPKGVGKGSLLKKLAGQLGEKVTHTIAVGDNDNDVSMLEAAQVGIAVANATPAAKQAADLSTVSNQEDAIAHIIDQLDRGEIRL
ncbi:MAG: HAD family phosphatase [Ruminococcaceae bacterium]|nr:HAD family phosphatase [Oscillospiraceae bacterium]